MKYPFDLGYEMMLEAIEMSNRCIAKAEMVLMVNPHRDRVPVDAEDDRLVLAYAKGLRAVFDNDREAFMKAYRAISKQIKLAERSRREEEDE